MASAAPGGRVLCKTLSLPMLETGSSYIVPETPSAADACGRPAGGRRTEQRDRRGGR
jgi:hypothetical protein